MKTHFVGYKETFKLSWPKSLEMIAKLSEY